MFLLLFYLLFHQFFFFIWLNLFSYKKAANPITTSIKKIIKLIIMIFLSLFLSAVLLYGLLWLLHNWDKRYSITDFLLHSGHLIKLIKQSPSVILFINNSIWVKYVKPCWIKEWGREGSWKGSWQKTTSPCYKLLFPLSASRNIEKQQAIFAWANIPLAAFSIFLRYLSSCLFQCFQFTSLPESEFFFRIVKHVTSFDAHNVNSADDNF